MSTTPDNGTPQMSKTITNHPIAAQNQMPIGYAAEEVAGQFSVSRQVLEIRRSNSGNTSNQQN